MERATDSYSIETAERLLKRYTDSLSFDSISIFKENGALLYSSDPELQQQEGVESLFEVLDALYYAFEIQEIRSIIVYDYSSCLIILPLYMGNWGEVEGWLFALGSCAKVGCAEIVDQLKIQVMELVVKDISEQLTEQHSFKLQRAFDLPNILGREFEKLGHAVVMLDGNKGFALQNYGEAPWGIITRKSGRKYPEPLFQLDEDLIGEIEVLAIGVPSYDPDTIEEEIQEIIDFERKPEYRIESQYAKSNKLLKIILIYSVFMAYTNILIDVTSLDSIITMTIAVDVFLLIGIGLERISRKSNPCCSGLIFLMGILVVVSGISALLVNFDGAYVTMLLLGFYVIMAGVLAYVTRSERMQG